MANPTWASFADTSSELSKLTPTTNGLAKAEGKYKFSVKYFSKLILTDEGGLGGASGVGPQPAADPVPDGGDQVGGGRGSPRCRILYL